MLQYVPTIHNTGSNEQWDAPKMKMTKYLEFGLIVWFNGYHIRIVYDYFIMKLHHWENIRSVHNQYKFQRMKNCNNRLILWHIQWKRITCSLVCMILTCVTFIEQLPSPPRFCYQYFKNSFFPQYAWVTEGVVFGKGCIYNKWLLDIQKEKEIYSFLFHTHSGL